MSRVIAYEQLRAESLPAAAPRQLFVRVSYYVNLDCGHGRHLELVEGTDPCSIAVPCLECEPLERKDPEP